MSELTLRIWHCISTETLRFPEALQYCVQKPWDRIPEQQIPLYRKRLDDTICYYTDKIVGKRSMTLYSSCFLDDESTSFAAGACLVFASTFHLATKEAISSGLIVHVFDTLIHLQQLQPVQPAHIVGFAFVQLSKVNTEVFQSRLEVLLHKLVSVNARPPNTIFTSSSYTSLLSLLRYLCSQSATTRERDTGTEEVIPEQEQMPIGDFILKIIEQDIFYSGKFSPVERQLGVMVLAQTCLTTPRLVHSLSTLLTKDHSLLVRIQTLDTLETLLQRDETVHVLIIQAITSTIKYDPSVKVRRFALQVLLRFASSQRELPIETMKDVYKSILLKTRDKDQMLRLLAWQWLTKSLFDQKKGHSYYAHLTMRDWNELQEMILQGLTDNTEVKTLAEQFFVNLLIQQQQQQQQQQPVWETMKTLKVVEHIEIFAPILYSHIYDLLRYNDVSCARLWNSTNSSK